MADCEAVRTELHKIGDEAEAFFSDVGKRVGVVANADVWTLLTDAERSLARTLQRKTGTIVHRVLKVTEGSVLVTALNRQELPTSKDQMLMALRFRRAHGSGVAVLDNGESPTGSYKFIPVSDAKEIFLDGCHGMKVLLNLVSGHSHYLPEQMDAPEAGAVSAQPAIISSWNELEIRFLSDERVQIIAGAKSVTRSFAEFGFEDRRSQKPNSGWATLRFLAERHGVIDKPPTGKKWPSVEKQVQAIRRIFRHHFHLAEDPLPYVSSAYQASFKIGCASSYKDKLTKFQRSPLNNSSNSIPTGFSDLSGGPPKTIWSRRFFAIPQ